MIVNNASGEIIHWSYKGVLITEHPIRPNFWRAPTDNDLGNGMHEWASIWKRATEEARPAITDPPAIFTGGALYSLKYQLPDRIASLNVTYTLSREGVLSIDYHFSPNRDSLPNIPRLGMFLTLPDCFTETAWYGRGPHETYWDRKLSGKIGIYNGSIADQFHRYPRPQETGNKTDIRWMQVSSDMLHITVHLAILYLRAGLC